MNLKVYGKKPLIKSNLLVIEKVIRGYDLVASDSESARTYIYDKNDRIKRIILPKENREKFSYDKADNRIRRLTETQE